MAGRSRTVPIEKSASARAPPSRRVPCASEIARRQEVARQVVEQDHPLRLDGELLEHRAVRRGIRLRAETERDDVEDLLEEALDASADSTASACRRDPLVKIARRPADRRSARAGPGPRRGSRRPGPGDELE